MINTILFDLDGTLLLEDGAEFTKAYFTALGKYMAHLHDPNELINAIWAGTKAMIKNDGSQTNEAVFWHTYCSIFGKNAKSDEAVLEKFYRTRYIELRAMCSAHPDLDPFIKGLKAKGIKLAVATNPLFPLFVQEERISWTGADPRDFDRITCYENSHYSKPNPAYYAEILEALDAQPETTLMIGNDVLEDMDTAAKIGIPGFLVTDLLLNPEEKDISALPQGNFDAMRSFVEQLTEM